MNCVIINTANRSFYTGVKSIIHIDEKHQQATGKKRGGRLLKSILLSLLFGISVWLIATAIWEAGRWDNLKMDELVNQMATPIQGTASELIGEFLYQCVAPGIAAAIASGCLLLLFRGRSWHAGVVKWGTGASVCVILGVLVYGFILLDVGEYLVDTNTSSDYIGNNYVDPKQVALTFPEQKRNLVYIWLESMETTFADTESGGAYDRSAIPELTQLAEANISFTGTAGGVNGGCSMAGATWTMGALFAQTCGLPLKIPITDSSMSSQECFFPGVTSLGDILNENGYQQALLIGSDATFGGRQLYFTEHGGYSIWDYQYSIDANQLPEDHYVWWGYEDEKLFTFAKAHLTEMASSGQPFNLSLLTVDTHFPGGYVCPLCRDEFGSDQYANVLACSSRQVSRFVAWLQAQPFYDNTTIVISGDHISMDVGCSDNVRGDYQRRVFTTIINPAVEAENAAQYRSYTTFDLFPTTLASLGVDIRGDRLGLGVNLFSGNKTLLERDGFEKMNKELKRRSDFVITLSGIDSDVYQMAAVFSTTNTKLEAAFDDAGISYSVNDLSAIEKDITTVEVFAEVIIGDTRTTLWHNTAEKQPDGSYVTTMPIEKVAGLDSFTVNIYATTPAGRIKIDTGYTCDLRTQSLVRNEATIAD